MSWNSNKLYPLFFITDLHCQIGAILKRFYARNAGGSNSDLDLENNTTLIFIFRSSSINIVQPGF